MLIKITIININEETIIGEAEGCIGGELKDYIVLFFS